MKILNHTASIVKYACIILATVPCIIIASPQANRSDDTTQTKSQYQSHKTIATLLNWQPSPHSTCSCQGRFKIPANFKHHPKPKPLSESITTLRSTGPTTITPNGTSTLTGNIQITQPGRICHADIAHITREATTGKINKIQLIGHVKLEQAKQLVLAQRGNLNFSSHLVSLHHALYRIYTNMHHHLQFAWGQSQLFKHHQNGNSTLLNATYSVCNPLHPTWVISAKKIYINRTKHTVTAHNGILRIHGVPILFTPYLSFSLDKTRKSGLLVPILSHSSSYGTSLTLPLYWNMATNYDATFSPTFLYHDAQAIAQLNVHFRHITAHTKGEILFSVTPHDKLFEEFKNDMQNNSGTTSEDYIHSLNKASSTRVFINTRQHANLSSKLSADLNINYATDDYYIHDYNNLPLDSQDNQLLNQIILQYQGNHWQWLSLLQAYQTLHQLNQDPAYNQYQRLPELDIQSSYPSIWKHLAFNLSGQYVNFDYDKNYAPYDNTLDVGQRLHLRPSISYLFNNQYGFIQPQISVDNTSYFTKLPITHGPRPSLSDNRNVFIGQIGGGLYLTRQSSFRHHPYWQTLQPQFLYTYIPYVNQRAEPLFDTDFSPFTFSQVFSSNAYNGLDRIQNTSQLALGLTSRIFSSKSGNPIMSAGMGMIYYLNKRKVCLTDSCIADSQSISPLAAQLSFFPSAHWSTSANVAWDTHNRYISTAGVSLAYNQAGQSIFNIGYEYVHPNPKSIITTPQTEKTSPELSSNLFTIGSAWPLNSQFSTLGYLFYDIQRKRLQNTFIGLQYSTCCWAIRAIYNHKFNNTDPTNNTSSTTYHYDNSFYLEIMLKDLGSGGFGKPTGLLNNLTGYKDPFDA